MNWMLREQKQQKHRLYAVYYKASKLYKTGNVKIPRVSVSDVRMCCGTCTNFMFLQEYMLRRYKTAFLFQLDQRIIADAKCMRLTEIISFMEPFAK